MKSIFALIAVGLDAAATRFSSKIKGTAAAVVVGVVGIGLLVGSLSLFAEPVVTGPFQDRVVNVCAPVVSSITVTDDGSAGFRVSVSLSHGWDMFRWVPKRGGGWETRGYRFYTYDAVRHYPLKQGDFNADFFGTELRTADDSRRDVLDVYFDYFARGGTGGKYFEMKIEPEWYGLVPVRAEHYYTEDHYVNLTLYVTNKDSKGKRLPGGEYRMHCWVSDSDGNGYYVTVYFGDEAFF